MNSTQLSTTSNKPKICKPILKWAGGKRQLLNELITLMPKQYNRYFEPFVGGGALFFAIQPKHAFINDYNQELINLYEVVRDQCQELIDSLEEYKNEEEYYYKIRSLDRNKKEWGSLSPLQRASRLIYLNKTGYNGLYRVNSKGENNVPFGRYKKPKFIDIDNLWACSQLLKDTKISCGDFSKIKPKIQKGDFIYFDPPYVPLNKTSSFTSYVNQDFDKNMQCKLKKLCDDIDKKGAFFMLSNSYTDFVLDLYQHYNIHIVKATRSINSNASQRGKIAEVVVTNYT